MLDPPILDVTYPTGGNTYTIPGDFATIEAAIGNVAAGDIISIKAGNYTLSTFSDSGTTNSEIVWRAFGDGDVRITKGDDSQRNINASHIIIDGGVDKEIIFDGVDQVSSGSQILYGQTGYTNITVRRCKFENGAGGNYESSYVTNCMAFLNKSDNLKFYNNEIFDCRGLGLYIRSGNNVEIRNNNWHEINGAGIQLNPHDGIEQTDETYISGNVIKNTGNGNSKVGIPITPQAAWNGAYDVYIYITI